MRVVMAAVIVMGVLIVAGVGVIGTTIARRMAAPAIGAATLVLDEPDGTRMVGTAGGGDRLTVLLQGGGPDRLLLIDPRTGVVAGRVALAR